MSNVVNPESRRKKLMLMRQADSLVRYRTNLGGVPRRQKERPKPSMPKMPWDDEKDDIKGE